MFHLRALPLPHLILAGLALVVTAAAQIYFWPHMTDDAYFTLRSARNLIEGHGPVFNPTERVEVFSNPLWMYLLAALGWLTRIDLPLLAKILGLGFSAGTVWAMLRFYTCYQMKDRVSAATLALVWLALTPGFQAYASMGLEVPLLTFLLTLGVTQSALALQSNTPKGQVLAAICFALAGITRPEGAFYALLWGSLLAFFWLRPPGERRLRFVELVKLGAITAAPSLTYEIFRYSYYGHWVANTALAKPPSVFGIEFFMMELIQWVTPVVAILLLCSLSIPLRTRANTALRIFLVAATGPLLAGLIFYIYASGDWMLFGRFMQPVLPTLMLLVTLILDRPRPQLPVWMARTGLFLSIIAFGAGQQMWPYIKNDGFASMLMKGHDVVVIGQWIEDTFPTPMLLVGRRTGAISYYAARHDVGDFFGLTQTEQALYLRRVGTFTALQIDANNPLLQKSPGLIMVTRAPLPAGGVRYSAAELSFLNGNYRCIKSFPQGNWGTYDMWLRSDIQPNIPSINCLTAKPQWPD